MVTIEISQTWFILILGALLSAILWPLIQFLVLPWKRTKQRIEITEKNAKDLKDKIDEYRQEASILAEQFQNSFETLQSVEQRITFIADKIGLKGDLLAWGRLMFLEGNLDEAIMSFNELLDSEPSNDIAHFYRGLCYLRKGKKYSRGAIEDLEMTVRVNERDSNRHLDLSRAYLQAGMAPETEREALQALNLGTPDKLGAKVIIGTARLSRGDYAGAINVFKECPLTHTPAVIGWGHALIEKAKQASPEKKIEVYTELIALYDQAMKLNPAVSDYYAFRGQAYAERGKPGDWEQALEDWQEAATIAPRSTRPWELKGDSITQRVANLPAGSQRNKGFEEALKSYGEVLIRAAELYKPTIRNKRSRIYQRIAQFEMALSEARAGARENPDYVTNFMGWATAAISAFAWKEATGAATSGLEISERRGHGGSIWCLLFRIIGRCGDYQALESIVDDCKRLVDELENFPAFDPTGWDWLVAEDRLKQAMKEWPTSVESLVRDSVALVEGDLSPSAYRQKYVKT